MTDLTALENKIMAEIESAEDTRSLEEVRVSALGKKGAVTAVLKTLGGLSDEERKEIGPQINGLKNRVTQSLEDKKPHWSWPL